MTLSERCSCVAAIVVRLASLLSRSLAGGAVITTDRCPAWGRGNVTGLTGAKLTQHGDQPIFPVGAVTGTVIGRPIRAAFVGVVIPRSGAMAGPDGSLADSCGGRHDDTDNHCGSHGHRVQNESPPHRGSCRPAAVTPLRRTGFHGPSPSRLDRPNLSRLIKELSGHERLAGAMTHHHTGPVDRSNMAVRRG